MRFLPIRARKFWAVAFALVAVDCALRCAVAESDSSAQSAILAKLASPKDESPSGTVINNGNIAEYQPLLPAEFVPAIQSGGFTLFAFRSLRTAGPYFDEEWQAASAANTANQERIERFVEGGFPRAFPYAAQELQSDDSTATTDARGQQLLWNTQAHSASFASYSAEFNLSELGSDPGVSLRGDITRIQPKRFRSEDKTGQLFRERLRVLAPESIKGLSWLTFRFFDDGDDAAWIFSPAIKKTRQITSSNRSDSFLGSAVSLEEFFEFSGKVQSFEAVALTETTVLAPFFSLDALPLRGDEPGCYVAALERKERTVTTNLAAPSEARGERTGIILRDMNFVPRKALRFELLQRDPYSNYGRQVLYVDAELFVPFYKFVYDRAGNLLKIAVTSQTLLVAPPGHLRAWLPMTTVVRDNALKSYAALSYDRIRFCTQGDSTVAISGFDPKGLVPHSEPTSAPVPSKQDFQVTLRPPQPKNEPASEEALPLHSR